MQEPASLRLNDGARHSLRLVRRLELLGAAVIAGVLSFGTIVLLNDRANTWERVEQASANLSTALERDITGSLAAYDLSIQGAAEALRLPGLGDATPEVRRAALFDRAAAATHLGSLLVLDASGGVAVASADNAPSGIDFATADYFRAHQESADGGLYIGRPVRGRLRNGDAGLPLSRRVESPDGGFGGVVAGTLKLAYFRDLFGALDLGRAGSVTLIRADGQLIARHPQRDGDLGRDVSKAPAFRRFMETGESGFVAVASLDNVERFYNFRRIGDLPLVLSVAQSTEHAFSNWRRRAWAIGAVLALLSAGLVTLCVMFRREVLRRLAAEASLAAAAAHLAVTANTDGLTGLANRRCFDETMTREWQRAASEGTELSLAMLDVDRFKLFNDRHGHQAGDEGLRAVARAMAEMARRPADVAARYGGEEMVLLLPNTDAEGARRVAEKARAAVEALRIPHGDNLPSGVVTASLGVATALPAPGAEMAVGIQALLAAADAALYRAKSEGRNRVEAAAPVPGHAGRLVRRA